MSNVIFSEGSGVADSQFGKSLAPIRSLIQQGVEAFRNQSIIEKVFYMDTSNNYAEKYTSETSLGDFADVGENGAYPRTSMREGYAKVIEPATWKSSFEVTKEMIEDAKYGKIKSRAAIFTTGFNRTREKFAAALLAGGVGATATFGTKTYDTTSADGVPLFSAAHPSITNATEPQSNLFANAFSVPLLDLVQEKMQDFRDDDGNLLSVTPNTILIPNVAALKRQVLAAVGSELNPEAATNALNFQAGLWNVLVSPYLPKTIGGKPYFMLLDDRFKDDYQCLPFVERVPLSVHADINPETDANVYRGRARYGAGFHNWRCIALVGEGVTGGTTLTV